MKEQDTVASKILGDWQLSGVYRWTSGRPQGVGYSIPGINNSNLTGSADGNPGARIVLTCDPGQGYGGDPYAQFNTSCFAPPQPGSDGAESARFFMRSPPINNLDASHVEDLRWSEEPEVRVPYRRVQRVQPHAVHGLQRHGELHQPRATRRSPTSGRRRTSEGFGAVNGVAPPRTLQIVTRVTF